MIKMHIPWIIHPHPRDRFPTLLLNLPPAPNTPILPPRLLGLLVPQLDSVPQRFFQVRQRPNHISLLSRCFNLAADDLDTVHVSRGRVLGIDDFLVRVDQVAVLAASLVAVQGVARRYIGEVC